ncbi:MAG TPA: beta-N-acetylhexosaminidase [Vicinamibacterales bacterium]|nr:beta-N-acetylhexosaminidase [Vicinamibacterales bacterium]
MLRPILLGLIVLAGGGALRPAQDEAPALAVVPLPGKVVSGRGAFTITGSTSIVVDAALGAQGRQLASMLEPATGFDLQVRIGAAPRSAHIALRQQKALERTLGDEGYRLDVTPRSVTIGAAAPAGVFYGLQTLRQLLPPEIYREAPVDGIEWRVPAVAIEDVPSFSWRGAHLDVARHFQPKEFVKKYLDLLALHKMNRFHWHLTDDQGWRLEIRQYPRLTEVAAWRRETLIGPHRETGQAFDGKRHGGFYTQDDVREIVAYAAARFITVVPEIDMPGHSQALIAAYPELGCTDERIEPRTIWGISPYLLNVEPSTISFVQNVLSEVLELFPGPWIHIGGDEAVKTQWKASPRVQARIVELGLKDEEELQSWFIRQMDSFLTAKGRRLIGWDEILEGGLADNASVMSWRGVEGAVAAARAGHDAVLTPTSHTYFDYYQSRERANEPLNIGGFLPLDKVYTWEPMPDVLEPAYRKHILGVQGQLWTEYLPNPKAVEYNAFPRLTALAEVAWTPAEQRQLDAFLPRLAAHLERLRILDVNFRPLDTSITPSSSRDPEGGQTRDRPYEGSGRR